MTTQPEKPSQRPARLRVVALRHDRERGRAAAAPSVVARGEGEVGRRILELARRHGVPVREDRDLLELLATCSLGDEIPTELFGAVAELLAYLYRLNSESGV